MADSADEAGRDYSSFMAKIQHWVQLMGTEVFPDMSWDQIAALRDNIAATLDYDPPHTGSIAGTYGWAATVVGKAPPDKIAAAVQSTPPEVSRGFEGWTRAEIIAALALLLTFIQFMFDRYDHLHPAPTPSQIEQVFNETTQVFNETILHQTFIAPPPPSPTTPTDPPHNPQ